jgi:hypothetical protein
MVALGWREPRHVAVEIKRLYLVANLCVRDFSK